MRPDPAVCDLVLKHVVLCEACFDALLAIAKRTLADIAVLQELHGQAADARPTAAVVSNASACSKPEAAPSESWRNRG